MNKTRSITKYFTALEQSEGVGAKVRRSIGSQELRNFTPFLMLDHFSVSPPAGFPDHPHHGQETITYVLDGMIAHEDFTGSRGVLRAGDLQFMTAGKGIVHSEIPVELESGAPSVGLQLWVDLPMHLKDCEPRYRDLLNREIPSVRPKPGLEVRVVSGESYSVKSMSELAYTPVHFYHFITRKPDTAFEQYFPSSFNVFMYVLKGSVMVNGRTFAQYSSVFFNTDGSHVEGSSTSEEAEFVLVGGEILRQPVLQYGPFVETSKLKMYEVLENYQSSTNGFERAQDWSSSIAHGVVYGDVAKIESNK